MKLRKNKNIKSPLPIIFICSITIVSLLNMSMFNKIYKANIIETEVIDKKTALSSLETEYQNQVIGKTNYIDMNGLFSKLIDKKELNERVKLNNGYFVYSSWFNNFSDMSLHLSNVLNIKAYLDLYDIPFAYVQTPHLIPTDDEPMIPAGYETHINRNTDRLLEGLSNNAINYLDLRKNFNEDNIDNYSMFYLTDGHWTTEAGFISHKYIARFIDEMLGKKISTDDYFIDNRYEKVVFENILSGEFTNRIGIYFTGFDDVVSFLPNFYTELTVETPSKSLSATGDFRDVIIEYNHSPLLKYRVTSLYHDYTKITNHNAKNDTKILLLRDSFTGSLAPFLALHYKEVHLCDVRYGDKQEGFIKVLHEVNPDIVLQVRITSDVLTDEAKALI